MDMKKMSTDRPQRRNGRGRPGRRGNKVDVKVKLERSRQSARECRARKKLRYQYLEDLVSNREQAIFKLREELELYKQYCIDLDQGKLPEQLLKELANAMTKVEISSASFIPMPTPDVIANTTSSQQGLQDMYHHQDPDVVGCFSEVPTTGNSSIDQYPLYNHAVGDCNVTYSNFINPVLQTQHYPLQAHMEKGIFLDRQLAMSNQQPHPVQNEYENHIPNTTTASLDTISPAFTCAITLENQVTCGNPVAPAMSQSLMSKSGGNMSYLSLLRDSSAPLDIGDEAFMDPGFSKPHIQTTGSGGMVRIPSDSIVPSTPVLPTILEEMNVEGL
ncbi:uncharacterized protein LOC133172506 isoform X2 [Saccostrea echinata]|uniref:uncharacterized protein LOC133172506 isoform X2 n=1 Tax=Saccostrea echinata TaxID=191078 RepID=UPI002A806BFA|nr:uncharacterized protein LOC133172506 isoform X2 [Saccostrea echinata]